MSNFSNSIILNLVKGNQVIGRIVDKKDPNKIIKEGVQSYVGTIKISDLIGNFEVPIYDKDTNQGYQRKPKDSRLNSVKNRISENPDDPTVFADSINLNLRFNPDAPALKSLLKPLDDGKTGVGSFWTFTYDGSMLKQKFQIVDGQTRVIGTQMAINEARDFSRQTLLSKLLDINININLSFTEDELEEAYQFYLINTHASSIPAEGAHRLLYNAYKQNDQNFAVEINRDEKIQFEINWGKVTDKLLNSGGIWSGKIRNYNESIGSTGIRKTVTIRAMSKNLVKHVYDEVDEHYPPGGTISIEDYTFDVIEAFWDGLKAVYPECEDTSSNIMKSSQAEVIFRLNASLVKYYFNNNNFKLKFGNLKDPKKYKEILKEFFKQVKDTDNTGKKITGTQCWRVGASGAMGKYTSASAKKDIFLRLDQDLKIAIKNLYNIKL